METFRKVWKQTRVAKRDLEKGSCLLLLGLIDFFYVLASQWLTLRDHVVRFSSGHSIHIINYTDIKITESVWKGKNPNYSIPNK